MNRWIPFLPVVALIGTPVAGYAAVYLSPEQAQQAIFPGRTFTPAPITLTAEQRKAIENRCGVRVRVATLKAWRVSAGGWFIVDEVLGKHEYITWACGIGGDGAVRGIEVLEYRETYGHEVRSPKWRGQFIGKTANSPLKLDADIQNISGATLSSRHVADGAKRLLATYEVALK
ncbi:MAG: FMN-binding protein [Chthoniobacteraceae bacterium]